MRKLKDTELQYINGDKILEGDRVEFEYYRQGVGVMPNKLEGVITYKNAGFYIVGEGWEKSISSILENNSQIPYKHPMNIIKIPHEK